MILYFHLQLVIKDGLVNLPSIKRLIDTCRSIVGHFRHSPLATTRLRDIQKRLGLPVVKLTQDVVTRWNYTLDMLISVLSQKDSIISYASDFTLDHLLSAAQWRLMKKVIAVLEIFKDATLQISEANSLLSEVLPTGKSLRKGILGACESDDDGVKLFKQQLLTSLDRRFEEYNTEEKLLVATAVDPR